MRRKMVTLRESQGSYQVAPLNGKHLGYVGRTKTLLGSWWWYSGSGDLRSETRELAVKRLLGSIGLGLARVVE